MVNKISIRKRRRDRTRKRIANQKRLDAIAYKELNGNMSSSFDTWGGTRCPDCNKPLPSRAFCAGYHTCFTTNDWVNPTTGETIEGSTGILSVGTSVNPSFCHKDKTRCYSESAKIDPSTWKLSNDYVSNKKELKRFEKIRQYHESKHQEYCDKFRNKFNFKTQIIEDWGKEPADLCLRILDFLLFRDLNLDHISLADLCFYPSKEIEVLKVLPYLTGDRTHLLDLKAYFDDGTTKQELTLKQFKIASFGEIKHPVTNEILDYVEASQWVFMYLVASDLVKEVRSEIND